MRILGLNAYHGDSAACLVVDGRLIAAAEEERFRRIKHWAGLPTAAIAYCLAEGRCRLADVDIIAVDSDPRAHIRQKMLYALKQVPAPSLVIDRLRNQRKRISIAADLAAEFPEDRVTGEIRRVEHHLAHLASAFLVSPFETAVTVSVDGFGDFSSAAWGLGQGSGIRIDGRIFFPHSLGVFYQALTQYLGFPHYGDEYKVMGLAPYGRPTLLPEMQRIVHGRDDGTFALDLSYFRHHREKIDYAWTGGAPSVGTLYSPQLEELLGPARKPTDPLEQRHRDIARSVQARYEEIFFDLLRKLRVQHGTDAITLAGGCAMNSVANGKIMRETPFRRVYVQSAAGDAGGAIGAAMHVAAGTTDLPPKVTQRSVLRGTDTSRPFVMDHAYWGPAFDELQITSLVDERRPELEAQGLVAECISDMDDLAAATARSVADGAVVGWFQGRMEWGPRALGNRSIVCDPRRADMKDILNRKIKRRESFRPFAPSVLIEQASDWFEEDGDVPFMMQVYQVREARRALVPAITHVDGSGRLQTVNRETNPRYHALISAFHTLTGVPMVLNTSFNENEPVVCRPQEALDCFLRTRMDVLVLGNWSIRRTS